MILECYILKILYFKIENFNSFIYYLTNIVSYLYIFP